MQVQRFCTGRTAHRGSRCIALLFLDHGTRRGCGVNVTTRPHFTPGKDPVPIVKEAGWAPGPVWTSAQILAPKGIRTPDRPAPSQLSYRLSYLAHVNLHDIHKYTSYVWDNSLHIHYDNQPVWTVWQIIAVAILRECYEMHQFNPRAKYNVSESRNAGIYGLTTAETYVKWLNKRHLRQLSV